MKEDNVDYGDYQNYVDDPCFGCPFVGGHNPDNPQDGEDFCKLCGLKERE